MVIMLHFMNVCIICAIMAIIYISQSHVYWMYQLVRNRKVCAKAQSGSIAFIHCIQDSWFLQLFCNKRFLMMFPWLIFSFSSLFFVCIFWIYLCPLLLSELQLLQTCGPCAVHLRNYLQCVVSMHEDLYKVVRVLTGINWDPAPYAQCDKAMPPLLIMPNINDIPLTASNSLFSVDPWSAILPLASLLLITCRSDLLIPMIALLYHLPSINNIPQF